MTVAEGAPRPAAVPDRGSRAADVVVGTGTPASCTSRAVVRAVAKGGVIGFDCGPYPVTIAMKRTAKVVNTSARVVLDGGGKVTLSGEGQRRILYMNTCDRAQVWTTSHCNDQAEPRLVLKRMRLVRGNSTGETTDGGGGGAVFVRGGRLTIVDSTFADNRCDRTGPDVGGAAVRVLDQHRDRPVVVRRSTFTGGRCSNGSALSSIGVSWRITGSTFTGNRAIGRGANPARPGTPGGGLGRRDLPGRRRHPPDRRGLHDHRQPRPRGRRRDLLRLQRPHRHAHHRRLAADRQPQRRLRDDPGDLLPRGEPDDHRLAWCARRWQGRWW